MNTLKTALTILLASFLTACGGGGGEWEECELPPPDFVGPVKSCNTKQINPPACSTNPALCK